jgi:ribonuclease P protein component
VKPQGISKAERIKSKKDFEALFSSGKIINSPGRKIKAFYIFEEETGFPFVKVAAAVSKKAGGAVWRNRVRRLIKESFRLNKEELNEECRNKNKKVKIIFAASSLNEKNNKKICLNDIMPEITDLLNKIKSGL